MNGLKNDCPDSANLNRCAVTYAEGTLTVAVSGEIDHHSAAPLRLKIDREILFYRPKSLELDLSGVTFMDSSGLGLILGRYTKAAEVGASTCVVNPTKQVRRLIELAGADRIVTMKNSVKG